MTSKKSKVKVTETAKSDTTLFLKVEDLIGLSFGASDGNKVNFKIVQTILHILARQMRMLEQHVEIKFPEDVNKLRGEQQDDTTDDLLDEQQQKEGVGQDKKETEKKETEKKETEKKEIEKKEKDATKIKGDEEVGKTGITVSEQKGGKEGGKDKPVLVVEKGPTRTDSRTHVGSIEVVTRSQFDLLKANVMQLQQLTGPVPAPTMPENQKLKEDLAKGTATLTGTMEAMQVNARVQAVEEMLTRMADMLNKLASAGVIPEDMSETLTKMHTDLQTLMTTGEEGKVGDAAEAVKPSPLGQKSVVIDPAHVKTKTTKQDLTLGTPSHASMVKSLASISSRVSAIDDDIPVSHPELDEAVKNLKEELLKNMGTMTSRVSASVAHANNMVKAVADKLGIALNLNDRIDALYSLTTDYAKQLTGFDSGLNSQLQGFQEQMSVMRTDLKEGLSHLDMNIKAESSALTELRMGYESMVLDLDQTLHKHSTLSFMQKQLTDELRGLIEWVEMLREQKADRDEVADGLRDKANITRLKGLLNEDAFERARRELNERLDLCYDKFQKQDAVWLEALKDLTMITEEKAAIMQLMALKEYATDNLKEIEEMLRKLEIMLGEPKAAMLTRQLAKNGSCGSCMIPALMDMQDANYGGPPPLPALTLHNQPREEELCLANMKVPAPPDTREHVCNRWVGGSHTLLTSNVTREKAPHTTIFKIPTKRYIGHGVDGRLYKMEEDLQPCFECNPISTDRLNDDVPPTAPPSPEVGAGDRMPADIPEGIKEEDETDAKNQ